MTAPRHGYLIFFKTRYDRVSFSDGTSRLVEHGAGAALRERLLQDAALSYDQWSSQQPAFWSAAHRAEQWRLYEQSTEASRTNAVVPVGEVQSVRGWQGQFIHADTTRHVTDLIESWPVGGLPAREITAVLDTLAGEGWHLISTTEDKGIYSGIDTQREAGPVTVRMLLRNST